MLTLGAWHVVSGSAVTLANGELLAAVCVVPPLCMLLTWRRQRAASSASCFRIVGEPVLP